MATQSTNPLSRLISHSLRILRISFLFLPFLLYCQHSKAQYCTGHIKVTSKSHSEDRVTLGVRVYASKSEQDRTVSYKIFVSYRMKPRMLPVPGVDPAATEILDFADFVTTINQGDDSADDEVELPSLGIPVTDPKVTNIYVTDCIIQ
jgi:hypothetical protein